MRTESPKRGLPLSHTIATLVLEEVDDAGPHQVDAQLPIFPGEEMRIGRDATLCSTVIPGDTVSKEHFRIYHIIYEDESDPENPPLIYCEDLESVNGTWVNDTLIGKFGSPKKGFLLSDGDLIRVKPNWAFRFHQNLASVKDVLDDVQMAEKEYFDHRFTIEQRLLGSGLFGTVHLAYDKFTRTQLACKVLNLRNLILEEEPVLRDQTSPEFIVPPLPKNRKSNVSSRIAKYLREVEILRKLDHPNIVSLKKAFRSENTLYLFQELATGGDLFSYLQSQGGMLSDLHSRIICRQIALAVQYLHAQDIAHRDLKPENILVTHTDIGHRIMLTDFGQAISFGKMTNRLMSLVGTPGYVAPEVFGRSKNGGYTKAIDMWSLGMITFCLLAGDTLVPQHEQHNSDGMVIPDELLHGVEQRLLEQPQWSKVEKRARDFIRKLLNTNAEERMTADEALNHCWFTEPKGVAREIEKLYERANEHWRPRKETNLVEELPMAVPTLVGVRVPKDAASRSPKRPKGLHDSSASPYYNVNKHLLPRMPTHRRQVLQELAQNSPQKFLQEAPRPKKSAASLMAKITKDKPKTAKGNIFGKRIIDLRDSPDDENQPPAPKKPRVAHRTLHAAASLHKENSSPKKQRIRYTTQSPESLDDSDDEIEDSEDDLHIPNTADTATSLLVNFEETQDDSTQDTQDTVTTQGSQEFRKLVQRKHTMSPNWTQEDQQVFEAAITSIPPFSSAKLLKEKIASKRGGS